MTGTLPKGPVRSRTAEAIEAARAAGRTALVGYLPAGYPDTQTSIEAAVALGRHGADVIELGLPYSDPVMDGPVIQRATTAALANGFRTREIFRVVSEVSARTDAPVLVMTYWNLVDRMGVDEFCARLAEAGGAGLITPDLVPEEAGEWIAAADRHGLDRVFLSAPSSPPERVARTASLCRGFLYAVSVMGVTGEREDVSAAAQAVVEQARRAGAENVCVGLGVSRAEHVAEIGRYADGAIVGTALVRAVSEGGVEAVASLAAELARGTRRKA
ncbi:tryptophan synthase alpha chain [Micrococcus cohnii]|uniref:Tryptophan synthase alpha chain n=1 Tax=Micrococcus cohnii TaxID=993416 RepID=A0A7W7GN51_9MICC|nr:tryptophan synthase subunit alpha [Micrococcus cohnii]MBB4735170.1 tryptophan synthase alpha chain [Micrococcus cohnii]